MTSRRRWALLAVLLTLAACSVTPGADQPAQGTKEPASTGVDEGEVTLTVWDQEVRGGQREQIERLNSQFERKYPNVTIKRVAKSFTDLQTTVKLAVSDENPPDVVQANQGRPVMGQLVKGGLLLPLDDYADAYGWDQRYSPTLLDLNSFSRDGREYGSGSLFGLSQVGEVVGVFYNKEMLRSLGLEIPATFDEFEAALARAKQAGEVPIQFGNLEKWPGIHEFQAVQNEFAPKEYLRDFVFARAGASFEEPANRRAAALLQQWADKGYFTPGFNGLSYEEAWPQFGKGEGLFLISGTWLNAGLEEAMGDDVGFFLVPPRQEGADPIALGGEGLPFAVTAASKHPDTAAAYIDFITNRNAAVVIFEEGGLPAMSLPTPKPAAGTSLDDIFTAWKSLNARDAIVPYLDYATPTFYDTVTAAVQELVAGKASPQQFVDRLQEDYSSFIESTER
jgi:raffinose/stachyose/melibiose transport system substrate-binding protein